MILVPSTCYWGFLLERSVEAAATGVASLIVRAAHRPQQLLARSEACPRRVLPRFALTIPPVAPIISVPIYSNKRSG